MKQSSSAAKLLNCVAERITEHFTNASRGNKLTDLRRKKIDQWGLTVKERGQLLTIYRN